MGGNNHSKNPQSAPSFRGVRSISANANGDRKMCELRKLHENIQKIIGDMEKEVACNSLLPGKIFTPLFETLGSLQNVLDPARQNVCYVVGNSCAGKSSLINSLANSHSCPVSDDGEQGTIEFKRVCVPSINADLYDCMGFGSTNSHNLVKQFRAQMKGNSRPDVLILVITRNELRNDALLEMLLRNVNALLKTLRSERYGKDVPVMCVLNKVDEICPKGLPPSEDGLKELEQSVSKALQKVNKSLVPNAISCITVSTIQDYGIDQLRGSINAQSPLNAQIIDQNLDYLQQYRFSMANKIIAIFSTATAAVSFLPLVDIVVVTFLQEWMYKMLACFSVDPDRTPDTFKTINRIQQVASFGIRAGGLFIGGILQLSVIGYVVGSSVCVGVGTATTAALGWSCYNYFVS